MWITRTVDAPAEQCWNLLVDTDAWPTWGPSVAEARVDEMADAAGDRHHIQAGSTGAVRAAIGPWIPFRITGFDAGRSWSWKVAGIAATSHRVEPLGADRCRVGFEVPVWAAPYGAVCAVALRRIEAAVT